MLHVNLVMTRRYPLSLISTAGGDFLGLGW